MVRVHPEGKITDDKYLWVDRTDLFKYIDDTDMLPANKELLKRFVHDARLGKTIEKGAKKKVGKARQIKYIQDLKKLDAYFRIPLDRVQQAQMEQFILDLEEGRLKQKSGKPYSNETQVCIKKIIIKFYRWLLGKNRETPEIVAWIDTSFRIKDYTAVSQQQVEAIVRLMLSTSPEELTRNRAIVMVLYDSGARADEFLNIRMKHLMPDGSNYKVRIEFSKTKPRTLTLPMCREYLDEWLAMHPMRDNPLAQLFPISYTALCHLIKRAGGRIGAKITPHSLRHASATYWAIHLSQYQLCYRFGWAMSSRQPTRYIDREGLDQERVTEVVQADSVQKLAAENSQLNQRLAVLEDQLERLMKADKQELLKVIEICKGQMDEEMHKQNDKENPQKDPA